MLAACTALEKKNRVAGTVDSSTQTEPSIAWPPAALPRWAWQAHACYRNQQCVETCVRNAVEPAVFERVSMAVPMNVRSAILHAVPYLPCFWFDINQALIQMCTAASFLANLPPVVAGDSDITSPCLHPRWRMANTASRGNEPCGSQHVGAFFGRGASFCTASDAWQCLPLLHAGTRAADIAFAVAALAHNSSATCPVFSVTLTCGPSHSAICNERLRPVARCSNIQVGAC